MLRSEYRNPRRSTMSHLGEFFSKFPDLPNPDVHVFLKNKQNGQKLFLHFEPLLITRSKKDLGCPRPFRRSSQKLFALVTSILYGCLTWYRCSQLGWQNLVNILFIRPPKWFYRYDKNRKLTSSSLLITYPLDLTKTRLQIQGEQAIKSGSSKSVPYRGMFKTAIGIVKEEGAHKLWQGMSAGLLRHVIYSGTRMVTFQFLRDDVFKKQPEAHFALWKSAVCGMTAGAFAQYIASPSDLLKVQLQMEGKRRAMGLPPRVNGLTDAFVKVWKTSGYKGLWKGSVPNMQRAALVNLGDLTTYDYAKRFLLMNTTLKDNHFVHVVASFCAGFMAAGMGTPADVIKTRVMNQPVDQNGRGLLYKSSIDCLIKTTKTEGFSALYKGFFPIWLRMAPWSLTFWLSYEEVMFTMRTNNL